MSDDRSATSFTDHFSRRAAQYAAFRPRYPAPLFAWLASVAPARRVAWDCATGSGQAALGLAPHFARVIATDASAAQLAHARASPNVEYRVARAEESGLPDARVDLVTVAQALHWLDVPAFLAEATRVLVPGGVIAAWSYGSPTVAEPALDAVVQRFSRDVVGPYWPAERALVDEGYRSLDFPFRPLAAPTFAMEQRWTVAELAGYLRTWSATARYVEAHGRDPVDAAETELRALSRGPDSACTVRWPLSIRAGREDRPQMPQRTA